MSIIPVLEGKAFENFKDSLPNDVTRHIYTDRLKRFLRLNNISTPDELLTLSIDTLEEMIKAHTIFLQREIKSPVQAKIFQAAIKHFCRMNKIRGIDWELLKEFKGSKTKTTKYGQNRDDAYTHGQINKLLSICDHRQRAIVLIYASTGIRLSALPPMKLKHIQKVPDRDYYRFTVYENDEEYYTLSTPECSAAIINYLSFRERLGGEKGLIEGIGKSDAPLIRDEFDTSSPIRKKARHITSINIQWTLTQLLTKSGIREVDHVEGAWRKRKKVKLTHGFRKFFKTQLLESHVESTIRTMLMGQDLKLDDSYDRPSFDFIVSEFDNALEKLTINAENRLLRKVEKLEIEKSEVQALTLELEKVKKKVGLE